jgi:hypothetical protein
MTSNGIFCELPPGKTSYRYEHMADDAPKPPLDIAVDAAAEVGFILSLNGKYLSMSKLGSELALLRRC